MARLHHAPDHSLTGMLKHVLHPAHLLHAMPINDPHKVRTLLEALNASLPVPMMIGPELKSPLKSKGLKIDFAEPVLVECLFCMGDEGGVLCELRAQGTDEQLVVSITHLVPTPEHPLAEKIVEYEKHRVISIAL